MAITYKVLGQSAPSATTDTTLYTVPSATEAVLSTITACNRGTANADIRIAVRPNGAAITDSHFLVFDATLLPKETKAFTLGVTMDAADVLTVRASTADTSFNAFGSEIA
jgi:hypothetical protein